MNSVGQRLWIGKWSSGDEMQVIQISTAVWTDLDRAWWKQRVCHSEILFYTHVLSNYKSRGEVGTPQESIAVRDYVWLELHIHPLLTIHSATRDPICLELHADLTLKKVSAAPPWEPLVTVSCLVSIQMELGVGAKNNWKTGHNRTGHYFQTQGHSQQQMRTVKWGRPAATLTVCLEAFPEWGVGRGWPPHWQEDKPSEVGATNWKGWQDSMRGTGPFESPRICSIHGKWASMD